MVSMASFIPAKRFHRSHASPFKWENSKQMFVSNMAMREAEKLVRWHQLKWLWEQVSAAATTITTMC